MNQLYFSPCVHVHVNLGGEKIHLGTPAPIYVLVGMFGLRNYIEELTAKTRFRYARYSKAAYLIAHYMNV